MYNFLQHSDEKRQEMLGTLGLGSMEELFSQIDAGARLRESLDLPEGISELEARQRLAFLASKNSNTSSYSYFMGGGCYNRFVPACIPNIVQRTEFQTAYTPYQPEISQGTLQVIYEYQTMICNLTGMDVSNAGVYDGATACAEAILMSARIKRKDRVLVASTINPEYSQTIDTYCGFAGIEVDYMPQKNGKVDLERLDDIEQNEYACILVQMPNYLGTLEEVLELADLAKRKKSLFVVCADPMTLSLLEAPGNYGVDIAVGDIQSLGIPMSFGGPHAGYIACKSAYMRQLPGRIVGMTIDADENRAFTLTLQAREQHIRREKATSNICSNQALMTLWATVYMSVMGPEGLKEASQISFQRAHYLAQKIREINGFELMFEDFVNEFVIKVDSQISVSDVLDELQTKGIMGGINLGEKFENYQNCILACATEMNTIDDIYRYTNVLREISSKYPIEGK